MIYVTGDTHGDIDFFKLIAFCDANPQLTRQDYVIIAGDFGGLWNENCLNQTLAPYQKLPVTILFVDGNHENFDMLESYPVSSRFGGAIRVISDNVIHLMRGQVYDIDGNIIFTFGGATSVDKAYRKEGVSWWARELPDERDLSTAIRNLESFGNQVDYIITHACDERAFFYPPLLKGTYKKPSFENVMLSYFEENVKYKHWYFGHYHLDGDLRKDKSALYQAIVKLGESVENSKVGL